jgi:uncharacterized membrane protein
MAESQMRHRQELESTVVKGNVRAQTRGQIMAFVLALIAIGGGIVMVAFNKDTAGLTSIITAVTALVGVFVYGRIEQARERKEKRDELQRATENPRLPFDSN